MAIAYQSKSNGGSVNPDTSLTWAHTCAGLNRILFVLTRGGGGEGDKISGVTYDSVSMTKIGSAQKPTENSLLSLWYLIAPSTGANNVVVTLASGYMLGLSSSYTGVKQSSQPDNSTTNTAGSGTSITTSLTPVADNCWTVLVARGQGDVSAGAGTTERAQGGGDNVLFDSNAAITPPGSTSLIATGNEGTWATVMASFSPYVPAGGAFLQNFI